MQKIAFDISPLSDGNQVRGVGYYTKNLLLAIQKELALNPDYHDFKLSSASDCDLIHYPFFDPFRITLPKPSKPFIVTVHDLIPREFKSHFPVGVLGTLNWLVQKHRLKKAKYIICPSHYAKYSISEILSYPADKIYTTYEAADASFKKITDTKLLSKVKLKYSLPDKFVLYVGDINWNKNIPSLVNACIKLAYPLVIAGKAATQKVPSHPWTQDILWLQRQTSPLLHLTGFVRDFDLPLIFNLATIYCQPSFAEGFGLPLLQAMQSGTATLFANCSSLPEISLSSGLAFDPHLISDLQNKLSLLWNNPKLRQKYIEKGIKRSKEFSWNNTAIQTLNVYHQALNVKK